MFIGEYTHKIDEKGRVALPAKFRGDLASGAVVTRGLDQALYLYTKAEWEEIAERLAALPMSVSHARDIQRMMLAGAVEVEPDRQGRVLLPPHLREHAKLSSEVVVAGLYKRVELWSVDAWNAASQRTEASADEIAEHLQSLGI